MKYLLVPTSLLLLVLPTACGGGGSGDKSKLPGSCYGTSGQTCTGTSEYESCVIKACDAKIVACWGSGYQSGSFSGPCADVMNCMLACPCDANYSSCQQTCAMKMMSNTACQTCSLEVSTCMQGSGCKQPVCTGTGVDQGSLQKDGGVSGGCATLAACCATIQSGCPRSIPRHIGLPPARHL